MRIVASGATHPGQERTNNEDTYLIDASMGLYIVCDGMGGHAAGEVASEAAAKRVQEYLSVFKDDLANFRDSPSARKQLARLVEKAIEEASRTVFEMARDGQGRAGMGTTMSLLMVRDHVAVMGHVGDTRVYLLRDGELHQLSHDHTFLAEFIRGGLSLEMARKSNMAHRLTQAVGLSPDVKVDTLVLELAGEDRLLLCSDGLVGHIDTPPEIPRMMAEGRSAMEFIDFGNEHDGSDNITALTLHATHEPDRQPAERKRTAATLRKIGLVHHVWLFEHLSLREINLVLHRLKEEQHDADAEVIRQGERGDSLFIVMEGELEVIRDGEVLNSLEEGEHFGEMALITQRQRSATVRAVTPVRLLKLEKSDFSALIHDHPRLGNRLLLTITEVLIQRLDSHDHAHSLTGPQEYLRPEDDEDKPSIDEALADAISDIEIE